MDYFLQFEPAAETAEADIKAQMVQSGLNISEWDLFNRQYFSGPGFFCERIDNIPQAWDEEGNVTAFVPGVHINLRCWDVEPDFSGFAEFAKVLQPATPYRVFG